MLLAENVFSIMFDVSCLNAPCNISLLKLTQNTSMRPVFPLLEIQYYVQTSRLNENQDSLSSFGAKLWNAIPNEFRQLSKRAFKKLFHDLLLSIMETEDDYVEVFILLQKIANSAATT